MKNLNNNTLKGIDEQNEPIMVLDKQSIEAFWSNVPLHIREISEEKGLRPYDNLQFESYYDANLGKQVFKFFATAKSLGIWFKNIYPNSIIQTEKSLFDIKPVLTPNGVAIIDDRGNPSFNGYCQYKVKIKLDENSDWNIIEGPITTIGQNYYGYQITINNLTTTAETKAIRRAYEFLGISDNSDKSDEYAYEPLAPATPLPTPVVDAEQKEKPKKTRKRKSKKTADTPIVETKADEKADVKADENVEVETTTKSEDVVETPIVADENQVTPEVKTTEIVENTIDTVVTTTDVSTDVATETVDTDTTVDDTTDNIEEIVRKDILSEQIHKLHLALGVDEAKLKNIMELNIPEPSLVSSNLYIDLKNTIDYDLCHRYFYKHDKYNYDMSVVKIKAETTLQDFITKNGGDIKVFDDLNDVEIPVADENSVTTAVETTDSETVTPDVETSNVETTTPDVVDNTINTDVITDNTDNSDDTTEVKAETTLIDREMEDFSSEPTSEPTSKSEENYSFEEFNFLND